MTFTQRHQLCAFVRINIWNKHLITSFSISKIHWYILRSHLVNNSTTFFHYFNDRNERFFLSYQVVLNVLFQMFNLISMQILKVCQVQNDFRISQQSYLKNVFIASPNKHTFTGEITCTAYWMREGENSEMPWHRYVNQVLAINIKISVSLYEIKFTGNLSPINIIIN